MWPVAKLMIPGICGPGMVFQIDGFRLIYLGIGVLMWFVSGVFSLEYMAHYEKKSRYYLFLFATFFATMGCFCQQISTLPLSFLRSCPLLPMCG